MARSRIKVAVLIGALDMGGSESDIARTFPLIDQEAFEVVVLEFNHEGALAGGMRDAGIRVISRRTVAEYEAASQSLALRELQERLAVLRWVVGQIRSERPDITHSVLPHSYAYQIISGVLSGVRAKTVMSRHSLNFYGQQQRFIAWLERHYLHRKVDIAIGNARAILTELAAEGVEAGKLRLVRTGVDTERFAPAPDARERARRALGLAPDCFVIVAVGNLHTYKGHTDLVEACAMAASQLPAPWALLVGGRDEEGNSALYAALAERLGVRDRVRFLGPVDDVPSLLHSADLFCQPSHHEGFGIAIAEAMAAGLPVVATRVGGIPELVTVSGPGARDSEETGWLVDPHDPGALADALIEAAGDAGRRATMGARARVRVEREFSIGASVMAYEAVYREIAS